jgi:hypothetical protein
MPHFASLLDKDCEIWADEQIVNRGRGEVTESL